MRADETALFDKDRTVTRCHHIYRKFLSMRDDPVIGLEFMLDQANLIPLFYREDYYPTSKAQVFNRLTAMLYYYCSPAFVLSLSKDPTKKLPLDVLNLIKDDFDPILLTDLIKDCSKNIPLIRSMLISLAKKLKILPPYNYKGLMIVGKYYTILSISLLRKLYDLDDRLFSGVYLKEEDITDPETLARVQRIITRIRKENNYDNIMSLFTLFSTSDYKSKLVVKQRLKEELTKGGREINQQEDVDYWFRTYLDFLLGLIYRVFTMERLDPRFYDAAHNGTIDALFLANDIPIDILNERLNPSYDINTCDIKMRQLDYPI